MCSVHIGIYLCCRALHPMKYDGKQHTRQQKLQKGFSHLITWIFFECVCMGISVWCYWRCLVGFTMIFRYYSLYAVLSCSLFFLSPSLCMAPRIVYFYMSPFFIVFVLIYIHLTWYPIRLLHSMLSHVIFECWLFTGSDYLLTFYRCRYRMHSSNNTHNASLFDNIFASIVQC